jgi:hypothetical protein
MTEPPAVPFINFPGAPYKERLTNSVNIPRNIIWTCFILGHITVNFEHGALTDKKNYLNSKNIYWTNANIYVTIIFALSAVRMQLILEET